MTVPSPTASPWTWRWKWRCDLDNLLPGGAVPPGAFPSALFENHHAESTIPTARRLVAAFGYRQGRRFVALFWEPCGDEASYDDGMSSAIGMCDNWLYLEFIHQPHVHHWREDHGVHLGNSDESAKHWLVADAMTGELYAASVREVHPILRAQRLPEGSQP